MKLTLPTLLTLFRIFLIPVFVIVFYLPVSWSYLAAAVIYSVASLTDWFDGYLARVLNQESTFGAFLDPVADKLMVVVAIVLIVEANPSPWVAIPSLIIISREITVSALREWMAELGSRATVKVSFIGKAKTTVQLISLIMMIYHHPFLGLPIFEIGLFLFFIAAILTLYSMYIYLKAAWPILLEKG
ncbi:MAG: CDP-diacylglycerol--glycerol-3-phosphate 3-phosphatidyltransferase [Gammaproteobacteria bacterium]|nr:CDP-diacylglycerol--glycerol-3-phosphate 3-phosphatidyltransferase [Gammaproteobacteria bacterium]